MQQGLYHKKITLSLIPFQRLGNKAHNCEIDYSSICNLFQNFYNM